MKYVSGNLKISRDQSQKGLKKGQRELTPQSVQDNLKFRGEYSGSAQENNFID